MHHSYGIPTCLDVHVNNKSIVKIDPNTTKMEPIEYYNIEKLKKIFIEKGWKKEAEEIDGDLSTNLINLVFPYPLNGRIMYHSHASKYDPETKTYYCISKPYLVDGIKFTEAANVEFTPKKGASSKKMKFIQCLVSFGLDINRLIKKNFTYTCNYFLNFLIFIMQVHILDPGGWSGNETFFKIVTKQRGNKFRENINKLVSEFPEGSKIEDYKEILTKEENGIPLDGLGKLLYEIKIDEKDNLYILQ